MTADIVLRRSGRRAEGGSALTSVHLYVNETNKPAFGFHNSFTVSKHFNWFTDYSTAEFVWGLANVKCKGEHLPSSSVGL